MLAKWDDPDVQLVYKLLCDDEVPSKEEHYEGWIARRIVAALKEKHTKRQEDKQ